MGRGVRRPGPRSVPRTPFLLWGALTAWGGTIGYSAAAYPTPWDLHEHYDGWRWSKWGEYIGEHTPAAEYLAHEPVIEDLVLFEVHEIIPAD